MGSACRGERSARVCARACRRIGLLALAVLVAACSGAPPQRPDLLLVTVDALRADQIACLGGPPDGGETICRLAGRGTLYLWALAPASQGGPAAASVLTSRLPSDHGLGADPASFLRSDVPTVAETLKAAGYRTAAFVSSPELLRSRNLDQGFDWYDDRIQRSADGPPARDAATTVAAALAWIDAAEQPWAVWIHLGDLHGPYPPPAIPDFDVYKARYKKRLARLDAAVSTLVDHLDHVDGRETPLEIVFAGLHGESMGEDGHWFEHGHSLGLEQLRVPLVWVAPGAAAGSVVTTPVSTLDIAPTWLRAAGLAAPESYEGVALPRPDDPLPPPGARALYAEHPDELGVASGRFFYVRRRHPPPADARIWELSDDGILRAPRPVDGPGLKARVEGLERRMVERWGTSIGMAPSPSDTAGSGAGADTEVGGSAGGEAGDGTAVP